MLTTLTLASKGLSSYFRLLFAYAALSLALSAGPDWCGTAVFTRCSWQCRALPSAPIGACVFAEKFLPWSSGRTVPKVKKNRVSLPPFFGIGSPRVSDKGQFCCQTRVPKIFYSFPGYAQTSGGPQMVACCRVARHPHSRLSSRSRAMYS